MPLYLDNAPVAICDRCSCKRPWDALVPDGNSPGLRVCGDRNCRDPYNPWRLAPIKPDRIALHWSRPDTPLNGGTSYPDLTDPSNPQPPLNTFQQLEGSEGINQSVSQEGGGGGVSSEGNP